MNVQRNLVYGFELGHYAAEAAQNICVKGEGRVDHSTVTRLFKEFHLGCKDLDDKARSDRPKREGSEIGLQTIEANQESRTGSVSGELGILKSIPQQKHLGLPNSASRYQNLATLLTHPYIWSKTCFQVLEILIINPHIYLLNSFTRVGCDTRSIFKRILTGMNSEFSFSKTCCHARVKGPSLPYCLHIAGVRIVGFIPFPRV